VPSGMKKGRFPEGIPSDNRPYTVPQDYRWLFSSRPALASLRFGPLASPQRGPALRLPFLPAAPCRRAHPESSPLTRTGCPALRRASPSPKVTIIILGIPKKASEIFLFSRLPRQDVPPKAVFATPGDVTASRLPRLLHPLPTPTSGWPAGAGPASARCLATQKQRGQATPDAPGSSRQSRTGELPARPLRVASVGTPGDGRVLPRRRKRGPVSPPKSGTGSPATLRSSEVLLRYEARAEGVRRPRLRTPTNRDGIQGGLLL